MTPTGIEPATFRFAAQHLNHCATAVPNYTCTTLKIYNCRCKYNMVIEASVMLIYWWLQFTDTPLFTMCVVTCILTSNIDVSNTEESSPSTASWCDLCRRCVQNGCRHSARTGFILNSWGRVILEKL